MTDYTEADAAAERRYPIQDGPSVPWSYMTPHESTAVKNHGQTLQNLAERGGLGCREAELIVTAQPLSPKGGEWNWGELKRRWIERAERVNNAWLETAQLRAENVRLAADLAAARTERDAGLVAMIESMTSHAEELRGKLDAVTAELDEARQAAADWRGLLACGWEEAEHVAHFIAWHHDEDCRREIPRHFAALNERAGMPAEVRDAARRLAAPHLNPPAEGGAK